MRKKFFFIIITCGLLTLFPTQFISSQIIADHSIVDDYDKIPQQYIDSVKKMLLIVPGESHSAGYRRGLEEVENIDDKYAVTVKNYDSPESFTTEYLRVCQATWGDIDNESEWIYGYGEEDWFTSATAIARTKAGILYCYEHDLTISAMGFGWCWDDGIGVNEMDSYLSATSEYMNYCTTENIPTKAFFTTAPVDNRTGQTAYNFYQRNEKIRDYVDTIPSAILFDYADILCYDENWAQTTQTWNTLTFPWISNYSLSGGDIAHIGMNGAIRLGKAMWWMLARIAGWDGSTTPSTATNIISFSIPNQVSSSINEVNHIVNIVMPYGTALTSLIPIIAISPGATINPASSVAQNFSSNVTYTITAEDEVTTQDWTVTLTTQSPLTGTNITDFSISGQTGSSVISATNHTVSVVMPNGTSLANLTPTITVSAGATINPTTGTPRNFTSPVTYTVTAQNGSTQNWTVTVTAAPSTATDITAFTIPGQTGSSVISTTNHTVSVVMPNGTSLISLTPTITVSAGATINPTTGAPRNFTSPVTNTVTAQDGQTVQNWVIEVTAEMISGLTTINKKNILKVYPNPCNNFCKVAVNLNINESYTIMIQDILGKVVYQSNEYQGTEVITVPLNTLKQGIYVIILKGKTINATEQLIIK